MLNQAKNIPVALPISQNKIGSKSIKNYDGTYKQGLLIIYKDEDLFVLDPLIHIPL